MKCEMYSGMRKLRRFVLTEIMYWLYARTGRSTCKDSGADGRRYLAIIGWFPIPLYIISGLADLHGSIWIFPLFKLDARVESELSLRLYGKTIEFDNAGYFILVRHEHCDS